MRFWKPLVQPMQPASISLRRPAGLMRQYTITTMVKINPAITLLFELCNFMLPRVLNNPYRSTGMLNIDEGIVLVDNRLKILRRQSVLRIQNARFIPAFLSRNVRIALLFKNSSLAFFNNARSM